MTGKDKGAKGATGGKTDPGVVFNAMDTVRNTISQLLTDSANHEILVLNVPMTSFGEFMKDIQALLTIIQKQTGKVFVPICLSHSPIKPDQFIIVLRTSDNVQAFPLNGWFTTNIPQLAKKFVTKVVKLDATYNPTNFHVKLTTMLKQYHAKENLNLIGGFQDSSKKELQLLFFKTDAASAQPISVFTEAYSPARGLDPQMQREEVENLINQAHLDNNGHLRCSIAIGEANSRNHFFVFEEMDGDRIYMIMRFQEQLQYQLNLQKQATKASAQPKDQVNFDELLTRQINANEHKVGKNNALTSLMINSDFETSLIITCM